MPPFDTQSGSNGIFYGRTFSEFFSLILGQVLFPQAFEFVLDSIALAFAVHDDTVWMEMEKREIGGGGCFFLLFESLLLLVGQERCERMKNGLFFCRREEERISTPLLHLLGRNSTGLGRNQSVQSQSRDTKHHHHQQQRKRPLAQGCCCCFSRQRVVLLFLWLVCVSPAVRAPTFHLKDEASFGCCVMDDTNTKLLSVDSIPFIQRSSNRTTRFWTYALVRVVLLESLEVVAEQKGFHGGGDGDKTEKSSENGFGSRSRGIVGILPLGVFCLSSQSFSFLFLFLVVVVQRASRHVSPRPVFCSNNEKKSWHSVPW